MTSIDKVLIEYAKLHVQLQVANELLQKAYADKAALEAKLQPTTNQVPAPSPLVIVPDAAAQSNVE
jgi:hypothetical protein